MKKALSALALVFLLGCADQKRGPDPRDLKPGSEKPISSEKPLSATEEYEKVPPAIKQGWEEGGLSREDVIKRIEEFKNLPSSKKEKLEERYKNMFPDLKADLEKSGLSREMVLMFFYSIDKTTEAEEEMYKKRQEEMEEVLRPRGDTLNL